MSVNRAPPCAHAASACWVTKKGEKLMDLPLRQLEQLAVVGNVQVTTPAVAALLQGEIDVVFFSSRFRYRGRLLAGGSKFAALRQAQLRVMSDEATALPIARSLVAGKLANQRTLLLRRRRREDGPAEVPTALDGAIRGIQAMRRSAGEARSLESLRGHEGKGAAHYFGALKALLDPAWGFERRAYYPPPDPVNAALSFGYAPAAQGMPPQPRSWWASIPTSASSTPCTTDALRSHWT